MTSFRFVCFATAATLIALGCKLRMDESKALADGESFTSTTVQSDWGRLLLSSSPWTCYLGDTRAARKVSFSPSDLTLRIEYSYGGNIFQSKLVGSRHDPATTDAPAGYSNSPEKFVLFYADETEIEIIVGRGSSTVQVRKDGGRGLPCRKLEE